MQAVAVAGQADIVEIRPRLQSCTAGGRADAVASIVPDDGISDVKIHAVGVVYQDAFIREPEDYAIFDVHSLGLNNVYSSNTVAGPVNRKSTKGDHLGIV